MPGNVTFRWTAAAGLLALMLVGLAVAGRWRLRPNRLPLFPRPARYPLAGWSGSEVALALFVFVALPNLAVAALQSAGLFPVFDPSEPLTTETQFRLLVVKVAISPLMIAAMFGVMWAGSRTRPRTLGLRCWRWQPALYLGYVCYLVVTPIVFGVQMLAHWLNQRFAVQVEPHVLQRLGEQDPTPLTWLLIGLTAVVIAPLSEELLFRGIMMPWLARRWWGGWSAMAGAIAMGFAAADRTIAPLAFSLVVSLLSIAVTFPRMPEQGVRRAILGTALLFAMFHYTFWPHPIPLFVLGIALGWLAHRSRGLLAPIFLHALFNATSLIMILLGLANSSPPPSPPSSPPSSSSSSSSSSPTRGPSWEAAAPPPVVAPEASPPRP
ncbi:MAG: CPBP family intramembrane metalloprotease [Gemmataceae bacterium]|nr:CPBP family intramembrane metalloprotease [Gemmataceae bacterium]